MNNFDEILWCEKYRPKTIDDCILPKSLKALFLSYVKKGEIPHLLFYGGAGSGKTTASKALCSEIGCDYMVINGSDESGIDTFRTKIKSYASTLSFSGKKKVIIIDEADYLNPNSTQPAMRAAMEEFSHNTTFILTCNFKNKIIEPLHSRCAVVEFKIPQEENILLLSQFSKRSADILRVEGVEFEPRILMELVKRFFPDFRRTLNELQRYASSGKIDVGILGSTTDVDITELKESLKQKNFAEMRKWVSLNSHDLVRLFRKIYDGLYDFVSRESIPAVVVILAKYQYQSAFVADQELNFVACLTEIMVEAEFV